MAVRSFLYRMAVARGAIRNGGRTTVSGAGGQARWCVERISALSESRPNLLCFHQTPAMFEPRPHMAYRVVYVWTSLLCMNGSIFKRSEIGNCRCRESLSRAFCVLVSANALPLL